MTGLQPRLFLNEDKKVYMEIRVGQYTAELPLPEHLAGKTADELQPFFDVIVPEMTKNLLEMHRADQNKAKRRAQKYAAKR